ncbi:hypothetical protein RQP46_002813 [Phenoliferia psychrophenolica]
MSGTGWAPELLCQYWSGDPAIPRPLAPDGRPFPCISGSGGAPSSLECQQNGCNALYALAYGNGDPCVHKMKELSDVCIGCTSGYDSYKFMTPMVSYCRLTQCVDIEPPPGPKNPWVGIGCPAKTIDTGPVAGKDNPNSPVVGGSTPAVASPGSNQVVASPNPAAGGGTPTTSTTVAGAGNLGNGNSPGPATQAVVTAVFVNSLGSTTTGLMTLAPQLATAPLIVTIVSTNAQGQETIVVSTVSPASPGATSNPSSFAAAPAPLAGAVSESPTVIEVTSIDAFGNPTTFLSTIVPTEAPLSVLTITSTDGQGNPITFLSTVPPSSPTVLTITSTDSLGNPTTFLSTLTPPTVITIVETDSAGR